MNIKKGDKVQIMRGKDSGKTGKVLQVNREDDKIIVEGVNMRFRHLRPRKQGEQGQRVEFPASMHVSSAMLICPKCNKPTRVSWTGDKGKKSRKCKKCESTFN